MSPPEDDGRTVPSAVRRLFRLCAVLCLALTIGVSLWPFDFQTRCRDCPNGVRIASEYGGLGFPRIGMVVDETAGPMLHSRLAEASGITIAIHARSETIFQGGPARIISLSDGASLRNFTLGEHRGGIVLRIRTPVTGANGSDPQTIADGVVSTTTPRLFVATYDGAVFRIYADGVLEAERRLAAGAFDGWTPGFRLYYGNEATGDRPWRGHLLDAAVYDRALKPDQVSRMRPEDLATPTPDRILHLASRCPPSDPSETDNGTTFGSCFAPSRFENEHSWDVLRLSTRAPSDYAQNALSWLPLGFLLALSGSPWLRRWRMPAAIALASLIVGVEIIQSGLFSRTSALLDAVFAMLGAFAGATLGHRVLPVLKRRFKS